MRFKPAFEHRTDLQRRCAARLGILIAGLFLYAVPAQMFAQTWFTDAFLPSNSLSSPPAQNTDSFLRAGPILVNLAATTSIEYTNNVAFSPVGQAGTELSAGINFNAVWQALQAAQFNLSGSWLANDWLTGHGPNQGTFTLEPGSTLRYSIFVAKVQLTPFVNLKRTYDPGLAPTVGNTAIFEQASYDGGLQVALPLNNLRLEFMALRGLVTSSGVGVENTDTDRRLASARVARDFNSRLQTGVEYYVVAENFKHAPAESSTSETARSFATAQLTATLQLAIALGMETVHYAQPALSGDSTRDTQLIGNLALSDRLRQNLSCTLRLSDEVSDNFGTDYYRTLSVALSSSFHFNEKMTLTLETNWQHITESVSAQGTGDFWKNVANLEFTFSKQLSVHLDARSLTNQVAALGQGYRQNSLNLGVNRRF